MRVLIETTVFLSLATGIHLALWSGPDSGALKGSGSGGDELVSLQASTAAVAEMVEAWERPRDVQLDLASLTAPEMPTLEIQPPTLPDQPNRQQAQPQPQTPRIAPLPTAAPAPQNPARNAPDQPAPLPPEVQVDLAQVPALETPDLEIPFEIERPSAPDRPSRTAVPPPAPTPAPAPAAPPPPAAARLAPAKPQPQPQPPTVRPPPRPAALAEAAPSLPPRIRPKPRPADLGRPATPAPSAPETDAPPATASSKSSPAAVAAGSGDQAAAGERQQSKTATLSEGQRASLLQQWGSKIRSRVARRAPRGVGKGTAVVVITLTGDGGVVGVSLQTPSGNAKLDQVAVAAVRKAGPFPAAPSQLKIGSHSFALPIASR